jgi:hypothetical protein
VIEVNIGIVKAWGGEWDVIAHIPESWENSQQVLAHKEELLSYVLQIVSRYKEENTPRALGGRACIIDKHGICFGEGGDTTKIALCESLVHFLQYPTDIERQNLKNKDRGAKSGQEVRALWGSIMAKLKEGDNAYSDEEDGILRKLLGRSCKGRCLTGYEQNIVSAEYVKICPKSVDD